MIYKDYIFYYFSYLIHKYTVKTHFFKKITFFFVFYNFDTPSEKKLFINQKCYSNDALQ